MKKKRMQWEVEVAFFLCLGIEWKKKFIFYNVKTFNMERNGKQKYLKRMKKKMNGTPTGNRIHIGFFGRRNAGKSSLVNAITGQDISVVSDTKGTTTDPVYKAMEWLPLGPVVIIDTPGLDDEGELGEQRVQRTKQVLRKTDVAVVVVDSGIGITDLEREFIEVLKQQELPFVLVWNKSDLQETIIELEGVSQIFVSAKKGEGIKELKEILPQVIKKKEKMCPLVADLLAPLDIVVLVVPIDASAPKGRLILPQQQVIRDILEAGAISVVVKDVDYKKTLEKLEKKPALVITDSQVFSAISEQTPLDVPLTSFSILMARTKGFLRLASDGVKALDTIKEGDKILIAEGCTHHRQCEDIGTVKLPKWICDYTKVQPKFEFCSGVDFPEDLSAYKLVIHCGGCMLNGREMQYRMRNTRNQSIPFTNYGTAIAHMNGILERSLHALKDRF